MAAGLQTAAPLRRNIAANYAGKLWSIASVYLFVPIYIRLLGVEAYGVVAFHSVLLGILFIADAGMSAAFAREVARSNDAAYLRKLLVSLERVYAAIGVTVVLAIALASGWIAQNWFNSSSAIPQPTLQLSIALMGASCAIQVAMSLYNGGLMGSERHAAANTYQMAFSVVRSGLVVIPLYLAADLRVYFAWQTIAAVGFFIAMRRAVWRQLGDRQGERFSRQALGTIRGFALGMLGMAVVSALNTQMDKLVISKLLPLDDFASYSIASLLAQAPTLVTLPIALSILPRLTRWSESGDLVGLGAAFQKYSFVIAALAGTVGATLCLAPGDIILLWTGNEAIASKASRVTAVLAMGGVLLALQFMPYHLAIANGHSQTNLRLGAVFLVVTPAALLWLTPRFGLLGAAAPWVVMNACAAIVLGKLLTDRFLPGGTATWFLRSTLLPLSLCGAVAWAADRAARMLGDAAVPPVAVAAAAALVMMAASLLAYRIAFASKAPSPLSS
jgi:O-antigen/teichoic acid export membrane protein